MTTPVSYRTEIRNDAVSRIIAMNTAAGVRVFACRGLPFAAKETPAVVVWTNIEKMERIGGGAPIFRCHLNLTLMAVVTGLDEETATTAAADLAEQIEDNLFSDPEWVMQFETINHVLTELGSEPERERVVAIAVKVIEVQFSVDWLTPILTDPVTNLTTVQDPAAADLNGITINWDAQQAANYGSGAEVDRTGDPDDPPPQDGPDGRIEHTITILTP